MHYLCYYVDEVDKNKDPIHRKFGFPMSPLIGHPLNGLKVQEDLCTYSHGPLVLDIRVMRAIINATLALNHPTQNATIVNVLITLMGPNLHSKRLGPCHLRKEGIIRIQI